MNFQSACKKIHQKYIERKHKISSNIPNSQGKHAANSWGNSSISNLIGLYRSGISNPKSSEGFQENQLILLNHFLLQVDPRLGHTLRPPMRVPYRCATWDCCNNSRYYNVKKYSRQILVVSLCRKMPTEKRFNVQQRWSLLCLERLSLKRHPLASRNLFKQKKIPKGTIFEYTYMGVSKNNGTPKSSHFNRVWNHYKPSILGYPCFGKHPYNYIR